MVQKELMAHRNFVTLHCLFQYNSKICMLFFICGKPPFQKCPLSEATVSQTSYNKEKNKFKKKKERNKLIKLKPLLQEGKIKQVEKINMNILKILIMLQQNSIKDVFVFLVK